MPRIAVIEDDRAMNQLHYEMLAQIEDVELHQAFNTAEARALLASTEFDLLVLDIELEPGGPSPKGGISLLSEYGSTTPVIIVTGMPEENLHEIALDLKAFEFVRKPVSRVDFLNKVRHALAFRDIYKSKRSDDSWPTYLEVDPSRKPQLIWRGKQIYLSNTELCIVYLLAETVGKTVEYEKFFDALKTGQSERVVQQHISNLRKAFVEVDPGFDRIMTNPMKGYFWKADAN
ncbi:response regulator transcription factor [Roseateles sp. L2-2]|uniref:response regulator transcription factor n=1 Tax=Roseateles sp. L2-2 TaxID=3422597 RepID=UPI003D35A6CB